MIDNLVGANCVFLLFFSKAACLFCQYCCCFFLISISSEGRFSHDLLRGFDFGEPLHAAFEDDKAPETYVIAGRERDGTRLYLCQVKHGGLSYPGKVVNGLCNIAYLEEMAEYRKEGYEIVSDTGGLAWKSMAETKAKALQKFRIGGRDVCRANWGGGVHPGFVQNDACYISYGGNVYQLNEFRVLALVNEDISNSDSRSSQRDSTASSPPSYLTDEQIMSGQGFLSEQVQDELVDGEMQSGDTLIRIDSFVHGDLDGDGDIDSAVVHGWNGGGSGYYVRLTAVLNENGEPTQGPRTSLGDRTSVKAFWIEGGKINLHLSGWSNFDQMFCTYRVVDGSLEGVPYDDESSEVCLDL